MKKILTFLTVIVFLITILIAGGCNKGTKQTSAPKKEIVSKNPTIYLKDIIIADTMHLEMSNERHPDRKVIDDLVTIVHPGDIVKWKKADDSNIKEIKLIRIKEVYGTGFSDEDRIIKDLYEFEIPIGTKPGIMIYEIEFIVHGDPTIHTIDPYLRIPLTP